MKAEKGNYLVFFPSYRYLEDVSACLSSDPEVEYIRQTRDMVEKEKQNFLNRFKMCPDHSTVGLAVLGGAFSEGIDLVSTRLIGAIIVGVGLPTVSYERNIIKDYFTGIGKNGFDYAYLYPGINKVMQAAGRVIRSEEDYGIVLFIDSRYGSYKYRSLLKEPVSERLLRGRRRRTHRPGEAVLETEKNGKLTHLLSSEGIFV